MSKSKEEWKGETALIDKEMLCRHLANLQGPIYYIAGPPTMVTAMTLPSECVPHMRWG
jgi:NAD(P)H-flavin reductase